MTGGLLQPSPGQQHNIPYAAVAIPRAAVATQVAKCLMGIVFVTPLPREKGNTGSSRSLSRLFYSVYGVGLSHHHHGGRIHHGDLVPQNCLGLLGASCDGRPSGTRSLAALDALGPRSHAQDLHPCRRACVVLLDLQSNVSKVYEGHTTRVDIIATH